MREIFCVTKTKIREGLCSIGYPRDDVKSFLRLGAKTDT
jgi:hypothetical protein